MSETTKALFKDALYQVLDNRVFRILVLLVGFLVLPTFLIAAKPDELVLLFGWKTYPYADVLQWFEIPAPADLAASHATLIQNTQTLLVDQIAGTFGLIFAIAATAFFVPRMVEKGAADTVFSKPVSRAALLLSRYVAGLLFVAILTTVLVVGMHLGLLLNSGYSDPGFLWAIPVMVYKYGILHAFSLLVAVVTRSSVAAILTTLVFFAFNTCVHTGWQVKEMAAQRVEMHIADVEPDEDARKIDSPEALLDALILALDVVHYTLPKTTDAAVISQSLRTALAERRTVFKDPKSGLKVTRDPDGLELMAIGEADAPTIARWIDKEGTVSVTLKRWSLRERKRRDAVRELDRQLADMGIKQVDKEDAHILDNDADARRWTEPRDDVRVVRETVFFVAKGHLFTIETELPEGWNAPDGLRNWKWRFRRGFELEGLARDPHELFQKQATWTGELKYNLWFSLGSTLAFVALTLALAWWRLSRIDF